MCYNKLLYLILCVLPDEENLTRYVCICDASADVKSAELLKVRLTYTLKSGFSQNYKKNMFFQGSGKLDFNFFFSEISIPTLIRWQLRHKMSKTKTKIS